jgi:hypothetical protein
MSGTLIVDLPSRYNANMAKRIFCGGLFLVVLFVCQPPTASSLIP